MTQTHTEKLRRCIYVLIATKECTWFYDARLKWRRFAKNVSRDNFIRLESGLNAIYTSSTARQSARFTKEDDTHGNPLLRLENTRQVLVDWKCETLGRLRMPHDHTGIDDAHSRLLSRSSRDEMLSIAVGLIQYPNHTDEPRIMMGGKNMKQAELGIAGTFRGHIFAGYSIEQRFFPYLGLNALTVI